MYHVRNLPWFSCLVHCPNSFGSLVVFHLGTSTNASMMFTKMSRSTLHLQFHCSDRSGYGLPCATLGLHIFIALTFFIRPF